MRAALILLPGNRAVAWLFQVARSCSGRTQGSSWARCTNPPWNPSPSPPHCSAQAAPRDMGQAPLPLKFLIQLFLHLLHHDPTRSGVSCACTDFLSSIPSLSSGFSGGGLCSSPTKDTLPPVVFSHCVTAAPKTLKTLRPATPSISAVPLTFDPSGAPSPLPSSSCNFFHAELTTPTQDIRS